MRGVYQHCSEKQPVIFPNLTFATTTVLRLATRLRLLASAQEAYEEA